MIIIRRIPGVSVVGVSICGAVLHNVGQMLVACAVVGPRPVLAYLPILLVAAAVTGTLTGIVAKYVFCGLGAAGALYGGAVRLPATEKPDGGEGQARMENGK